MDSLLDWQPKVVRQACNLDCLATVWVSLSKTDEDIGLAGKSVCVYEHRNTEANAAALVLDAQSLVSEVRQDEHPSTATLVPSAEEHFLQMDTGQIGTTVSGFAKV